MEPGTSPTELAPANPPTRRGERFDRAAGLELLTRMPLGEAMRLADEARVKRLPGNTVTFVFDTNPNYTNVCLTDCAFCSFHRRPDHAEAYTLTPEELAAKVKRAYDLGATTVLLQGGHNPRVRLSDWIAYVRAIQAACPNIQVHPFSPPEYAFMAKLEKTPVREVLQAVYAEGVDTLPGGGAEILDERVRGEISPRKATAAEWLEVSRTAHEIGFRSTATMMYGHLETAEEIISHFIKLRELQDHTGGFSSFIPWSFKPGNSVLAQRAPLAAHPARYARLIAVARLLLDNFPHIQSSWFSESVPAGQLGLLAGADDFGGILVEENVLREAGHERGATLASVLTVIRRAGFAPARRDSHYRVVEVY